MSQTTSSLSDYLAQLGIDVNNMQEFLNKLSQMLSTKSDTVSVTQTLSDGTTQNFLIPSFGYLSGKVSNLENKFNDLLNGNSNQIGIKDANGNVKTFELKDVSSMVSELDAMNTKSVQVPTAFNYKSNWFFESFLNPLLYININVSTVTSDIDVNKFEIKRLIVTSGIKTDLDYFDSTYKGNSGLNYASVLRDLNTRGIQYFEDSKTLELNPAKNTVRGMFDILNIQEASQSEVISGQTLTVAVRKYKLNTLRYTEITTGALVDRTLKAGDHLLTPNGSEYIIDSIDSNTRTVMLSLIFGTEGLAQGAKQLTIKPNLIRDPNLQLNLGYNERAVVFLRPISDRLAVTTDQYTQGFGIYTNDLTITMTDGTQLNLDSFYKSFVSDFGMLFLNYAKERRLPSSLGEVPNQVTISTTNFKVIQTNQHIQDADNTLAIKQKIASKEQTAAQIKEIDKQISTTRANLNTNASLNESQRLKLQKDLQTHADTRITLTKTQQSLVTDITTSIASTPSFVTTPLYAVRGFWAIPEPVLSTSGIQQVVQFKVSYRTLSKTGSPKSPDQIEFSTSNGTKITGSFSPWTEFLTKARTKKHNDSTGFYEWVDESVSDPTAVNSNQLDIPIKKGEIIEIKIKSVSEAGWPDNPIESEWCQSVLIEFPKEIETAEDATIVSQQSFADKTRLDFQDELNSKGLDIHLASAFTTRDKYFAHKLEDLASGFFASDGSVVDAYTKLKALSDSISSIQTSLSTGKGLLNVSIVDQLGNQRTVTNGQLVDLFSGYYKDLIKDTSSGTTVYHDGRIITIQYLIQIQNDSQTPLQLISTLNGGSAESAPASDPTAYPTVGYHTALRYDLVPLVINNSVNNAIGSLSQKDGYQSAQVKSQFIYSRFKDIKVANSLYANDGFVTSAIYGFQPGTALGTYAYNGVLVGPSGAQSTIPYVFGHYLPFNPTLTTSTLPSVQIRGTSYATTTNANVWIGTLTGSVPDGGGLLTEFCIHKTHPELTVAWTADLYNPGYASTDTNQRFLPFAQAIHSEIGEVDGTNQFGASYFQQAEFSKPAPVNLPTASAAMVENQYPIKNGYLPNDEYLIGKYTCGAYLYMAPTDYSTISVAGLSPTGSSTSLAYGSSAAIKIPLIFQFRCSDKLGFIGGWRADNPSGLKNVKYTKRIGLDLYTSDQNFSFDVRVSGQYQKETAVVTPITAVTAVPSTA